MPGAFTGATAKSGLIEEAENGTLFLDEIGEMPMMLQAKLLRAIQERKARRLGNTVEYCITCRFIAATNKKDLKTSSATFRRDLYYRLAGSIITLPTLKEREDDYIEITKHVYKSEVPLALLEQLKVQVTGTAMEGNIRELINYIEEYKALSL
jgi:transcriptional regulator with PAS, ATPase and Fis domain